MKRIISFLLAILIIIAFSGCATIVTKKSNLTKNPKGVRVYSPRVYLLVKDGTITTLYLPDYENAYDIKPRAILSKNTFSVTMYDGKLTGVSSALDTTAVVELMKELVKSGTEIAPLLLKGAGRETKMPDEKFVLPDGFYRLEEDGLLCPYEFKDGVFRPVGVKDKP